MILNFRDGLLGLILHIEVSQCHHCIESVARFVIFVILMNIEVATFGLTVENILCDFFPVGLD